ncbi:16599_t:CDS:1, partial [Dentiscutata heterogama]
YTSYKFHTFSDFSIDIPRASNNNQHELDNNRHKKILTALNEYKNNPNKS